MLAGEEHRLLIWSNLLIGVMSKWHNINLHFRIKPAGFISAGFFLFLVLFFLYVRFARCCKKLNLS